MEAVQAEQQKKVLLTQEEVAELLRFSVAHVRQRTLDRSLPGLMVLGRKLYRYRSAVIHEWSEAGGPPRSKWPEGWQSQEEGE